MVSVIIPNYNHAPFLAERIESVLNQTYTDFECIILDDASTDGSKEIIERYGRKDPRVSYVISGKNSGSPFVQWNKGVQMAKGDYIWIAESDDTADVYFLETTVEQLKKTPKTALAYCQSYKTDKGGNITGNWKEWTDAIDAQAFDKDFIMDGKEYINRFLIYRNTIPNASAVVFKKTIYQQTGGADENIRNCSDWLTWLKILWDNEVVFVAKPLNYFRRHEESVIAKAHQVSEYSYEFDYDMRRAFNAYMSHSNNMATKAVKKINDSFIFQSIGNYGLYNFRHGKVIKGLKQVVQASLYPSVTLNYFKRLIYRKVV